METSVDDLLKEKDKPETKAKIATDLTPQIAKRAYELYEQQDHKGDSAIQDWSQAEQEIREVEAKPKTEATPEPEPEAKAEPEPEEPRPEKKVQ